MYTYQWEPFWEWGEGRRCWSIPRDCYTRPCRCPGRHTPPFLKTTATTMNQLSLLRTSMQVPISDKNVNNNESVVTSVVAYFMHVVFVVVACTNLTVVIIRARVTNCVRTHVHHHFWQRQQQQWISCQHQLLYIFMQLLGSTQATISDHSINYNDDDDESTVTVAHRPAYWCLGQHMPPLFSDSNNDNDDEDESVTIQHQAGVIQDQNMLSFLTTTWISCDLS